MFKEHTWIASDSHVHMWMHMCVQEEEGKTDGKEEERGEDDSDSCDKKGTMHINLSSAALLRQAPCAYNRPWCFRLLGEC